MAPGVVREASCRAHGASDHRWRAWVSREPASAEVRGGRGQAAECRCWPSPHGFPQGATWQGSGISPLPYLRKIWREAAWEGLWAAFDTGLGGVPADLQVETQAVRGDPGPVLVEIADKSDDLLIIGTGRRAGFGRMMRKSVSRYCLAHARCPVLAVPPSALMDEMSHPLHSWRVRRRSSTPDTPDM